MDTLCLTNLSFTYRKAGSAAEMNSRYGDMARNYYFVVFATETMGFRCQERRIRKMLIKMTGDKKSKKYLEESRSKQLWKILSHDPRKPL